MDLEKIGEFEKVSTDDFLQDHEFGVVLRQRNTREFKGLRNRCREFVGYLVDKVLSHPVVSLNFMQGLYCFCPELLREGDDHDVFSLFNKLLYVLERSGSVSSCDSKAAVEELVTYVVDLRARHVTSGGSAEDICDIASYLLGDYNFVSRSNLCRVLKLCCLVVQKPVMLLLIWIRVIVLCHQSL